MSTTTDDRPAPRIRSFAPLVDARARILILGSMPGVASLRARQYYAHPQNHFWRIMGELCGASGDLPYAARLAALQRHGIALWDVLHSCVRTGSLDAAIDHDSAQANDVPGLLRRHPGIERVCCNGGTSHRVLQRYCGAQLLLQRPQLLIRTLPSTSPANAGVPYARKLALWSDALAFSAVSAPRRARRRTVSR